MKANLSQRALHAGLQTKLKTKPKLHAFSLTVMKACECIWNSGYKQEKQHSTTDHQQSVYNTLQSLVA